jgi:hypothetical protein
MKEIKSAVKGFKRAKEKLTLSCHVLNTAVETIINNNPTIEELEGLIDELPKDYTGTRRVYELIYRKQYRGDPSDR